MGGVVFRVGGALFFLPATVAIKVMPMPEVARMPGAPEALVGVALVDGATLPVVAIGPSRAAMLVCTHLGERIALVGLEVVASGSFEAAPDGDGVVVDQRASGGTIHERASGERGVVVEGSRALPFDIEGVVSRMREGRWAV